MTKILKTIFRNLTIALLFINTFSAQPNETENSAELQIAIEKLNVLGSVLYIGAHPDDENTGLLAYLAKGRKYRSAYLSLTRGDGGQNLIGSEKGSEIGLIRTQELLRARDIDGAEQYFTRAVDFGFSKSAEETFKIWNKEEVLSDIVWVIRNFKPDIIITRFPPGESGGHGHHTASAELAKEAFSAAADPMRFPEQLNYVTVWKTKRLFWNNFRPTEEEVKNSLAINTGSYNSLLGKSYTEIAAESRSMHKSQGFGVSAIRGERIEYFTFIEGDSAKSDIMEGIDVSWGRIENSSKIQSLADEVQKSFNPLSSISSLDGLIELHSEMVKHGGNYWIDTKIKELQKIIQSCSGLWIEAIASEYSAAPGDELTVRASVINRTVNRFIFEKVEFSSISLSAITKIPLALNRPALVESKIKLPENFPISQPYWLEEISSNGLFKVKDKKMVGMAENPPAISANLFLSYDKDTIIFTVPLMYRWNDKVEGEKYRPFEIRPPVTANTRNKVEIFTKGQNKEIRIIIKSGTNNISGEVHLTGEDGRWEVSPSSIPFSLKNKYDEMAVIFNVRPLEGKEATSRLKAEITVNNKKYSKSLVEIKHPHIKPLSYFPESYIKLVNLDVKKVSDLKIGYIMGSGDEIPECLRSMGYSVDLLSDDFLEEGGDLSKFDVIIAGIRAYNTRERIKFFQWRLLDYIKEGGTFIVQYNVPTALQISDIAPYPLTLGNERITVENSPVEFINKGHQLLNYPNKITEKDFDGWVQERGLYFASKWDKRYEIILSGHDPNESPLEGGMLFTHYGKGIFIYTGYSWFRQLPEGIAGAYRIFDNMISAGKYAE